MKYLILVVAFILNSCTVYYVIPDSKYETARNNRTRLGYMDDPIYYSRTRPVIIYQSKSERQTPLGDLNVSPMNPYFFPRVQQEDRQPKKESQPKQAPIRRFDDH